MNVFGLGFHRKRFQKGKETILHTTILFISLSILFPLSFYLFHSCSIICYTALQVNHLSTTQQRNKLLHIVIQSSTRFYSHQLTTCINNSNRSNSPPHILSTSSITSHFFHNAFNEFPPTYITLEPHHAACRPFHLPRFSMNSTLKGFQIDAFICSIYDFQACCCTDRIIVRCV